MKTGVVNTPCARPTISDESTYFVMTAAAHYEDLISQPWTANITLITSPALFVLQSSALKTAITNMTAKSTATTITRLNSHNDAMAVELLFSSNSSRFSGTDKISIGIQNAI